jgi:hypothetical protein
VLLLLIAAVFTLATVVWTVATVGSGAPEWKTEEPIREVLRAGLVALGLGALGLRIAGPPRWRAPLVRLPSLMAAFGLLGHVVAVALNRLEPLRAVAVPDYGETLHPAHPGGTLWFLFLWGAPLVCLAARSTSRRERWGKLVAGWLGLYYAGVGLASLWARITETAGSLPGRAVFGVLLASGVVGLAALVGWRSAGGSGDGA